MSPPNRDLTRSAQQVGPFLKWAGGKGRLLPQFRRFLPPSLHGRHYVEPFLGSGAVFFYVIQNLHPDRCTLLDVNPELINTYQQIRDDPEAVIAVLREHKIQHNRPGITEEERRRYYYRVRALDADLESLPLPVRAARFVYLNKTCFNGLHRLNSQGRFNVPMGRYRSPAIFCADHLRRVSALLQGVTIDVRPFHQCETLIGEGDFVYCDPPYEPLSRTSSFTGYSRGEFTGDNQRELRDILRRLRQRCDWMLSNSTAALIQDLYTGDWCHKHLVSAGRAINSVAARRGRIHELVITSYPVAPPTDGQVPTPLVHVGALPV